MLLRSVRECASIWPSRSSAPSDSPRWCCRTAMNPILACDRAESSGRAAEAAAEGAREVRRLAVADQPRHVGHGDRRLLDQQRRRGAHASLEQVLVEALV